MMFLNSFVLSCGAFLALSAVVTAWLFRISAAPLWQKLIIPTALVGLACYLPGTVNALLGFPVSVAFDQLPERAELVAFVAHDEVGVADLWLKETDTPRAYETTLDGKMKKVLREAQERQGRGERTMLTKRGGKSGKDGAAHPVMSEDVTHTSSEYIVDPDVFNLPPKGGDDGDTATDTPHGAPE